MAQPTTRFDDTVSLGSAAVGAALSSGDFEIPGCGASGSGVSWVELRYHGSIVAFGWHSSVLVDQDFKSGVPRASGVLRDID